MMMIRSLATGIMAAMAVFASPAMAQSGIAARAVPVQGNAPNVCVLQNPTLLGGGQINFRGLNGSTLQIETLVDPTTLAARGASADLRFDAVCNFPHRLRIEAQNNGLWQAANLATTPSGFAYAIPYSASLTWGPQSTTLNADAQTRLIRQQTINVAQPTAGQITLRVEIQPGASNVQSNAPILAGSYSDTLRVTLEPQQ